MKDMPLNSIAVVKKSEVIRWAESICKSPAFGTYWKNNSYDKSIQFRIREKQQVGILLIRTEYNLHTTIYRKWNANIYIITKHLRTLLPCKKAVINTHIHIALKVFSTEDLLQQGIIKSIPKMLDMPLKHIQKLID